MRFVPDSISRTLAEQALLSRKHAPAILFGAGVVSMVGSTVLACRATLKMEEVLQSIEADKQMAHDVKAKVEAGEVGGDGVTYTDDEMKKDISIITVRGVVKVVKLYAPAVILGGVGILCLTKSHTILRDRNTALTAALVAVDTAFKSYRGRVVERYGESIDRELRYGAEEVDIIDEETGKVTSTTRVAPGEPSGYARWFEEGNRNWTNPETFPEYNWIFLRNQQNWANDMLHSRGHVFLNEVYSQLGLSHTSAGAIVGWVYDRDNESGDNFISFGCIDDESRRTNDFFNGRAGSILLDFNVDGPIWDLMDKRKTWEP